MLNFQSLNLAPNQLITHLFTPPVIVSYDHQLNDNECFHSSAVPRALVSAATHCVKRGAQLKTRASFITCVGQNPTVANLYIAHAPVSTYDQIVCDTALVYFLCAINLQSVSQQQWSPSQADIKLSSEVHYIVRVATAAASGSRGHEPKSDLDLAAAHLMRSILNVRASLAFDMGLRVSYLAGVQNMHIDFKAKCNKHVDSNPANLAQTCKSDIISITSITNCLDQWVNKLNNLHADNLTDKIVQGKLKSEAQIHAAMQLHTKAHQVQIRAAVANIQNRRLRKAKQIDEINAVAVRKAEAKVKIKTVTTLKLTAEDLDDIFN